MKTVWLTIGLLAAASAAKAQTGDGKTLYEKNCRMCHGANGTPPATMLKMMPALPTLNAKFLAARSDDSVVKVLTNGTAKMKSYLGKLTPEGMAAVAKYLRELVKAAK